MMCFVNRRTGEYSTQDTEPTPREDYYALSEDEYNFYEPIHRRRAEALVLILDKLNRLVCLADCQEAEELRDEIKDLFGVAFR